MIDRLRSLLFFRIEFLPMVMASPRPTQQQHSADGFHVAAFHSTHTEHNLVSHFP